MQCLWLTKKFDRCKNPGGKSRLFCKSHFFPALAFLIFTPPTILYVYGVQMPLIFANKPYEETEVEKEFKKKQVDCVLRLVNDCKQSKFQQQFVFKTNRYRSTANWRPDSMGVYESMPTPTFLLDLHRMWADSNRRWTETLQPLSFTFEVYSPPDIDSFIVNGKMKYRVDYTKSLTKLNNFNDSFTRHIVYGHVGFTDTAIFNFTHKYIDDIYLPNDIKIALSWFGGLTFHQSSLQRGVYMDTMELTLIHNITRQHYSLLYPMMPIWLSKGEYNRRTYLQVSELIYRDTWLNYQIYLYLCQYKIPYPYPIIPPSSIEEINERSRAKLRDGR